MKHLIKGPGSNKEEYEDEHSSEEQDKAQATSVATLHLGHCRMLIQVSVGLVYQIVVNIVLVIGFIASMFEPIAFIGSYWKVIQIDDHFTVCKMDFSGVG